MTHPSKQLPRITLLTLPRIIDSSPIVEELLGDSADILPISLLSPITEASRDLFSPFSPMERALVTVPNTSLLFSQFIRDFENFIRNYPQPLLAYPVINYISQMPEIRFFIYDVFSADEIAAFCSTFLPSELLLLSLRNYPIQILEVLPPIRHISIDHNSPVSSFPSI